MTDHPTPEATEREARERCERAVLDYGHLITLDEARDRLDSYAAAVRRAERERLAGIVESGDTPHIMHRAEVDEFYGRDGEIYVSRAAILAALREAK